MICSASILSCLMTMMSSFAIFFIFQIFIFKFFFTNVIDFCSSDNSFIYFFLRLIIFTACSYKFTKLFQTFSLPLNTSYLFSILLNQEIVDIEKPDGIFSLTFVVDEFLDYCYIHQSIHSRHSRSA